MDVLGKFGDEHSKELELLVLSKLNYNKKTAEGVYAGCVGVRKNYRYV